MNSLPTAAHEISPPAPSNDAERWFAEEVHAHDAQLKSYLRRAYPNVRSTDDVVQETYLRVWKAHAAHPIQFAKAFLFTVARRLALDVGRKERGSPIIAVGDLAGLSVIEDRPHPAETLNREEKGKLLGEALGSLPDRCREVVFLHKIKGLSQREVATQLGLSEKTVANQIGQGVKRCEEFFRKRGVEFF